MNFPRPAEGPFVGLLVKGLARFFFILCLFCLFLYVLGTSQEFTDRTQLLLLQLTMGTGLFLTLVSLYGIVLSIRVVLRRRGRGFLYGAVAYVFAGFFGILAAVFAAFITAAAEGRIR